MLQITLIQEKTFVSKMLLQTVKNILAFQEVTKGGREGEGGEGYNDQVWQSWHR